MIWLKNREKLQFLQNIIISEKEYIINVIFSKKKSSSVSINDNKLNFRLSSYLTNKQAEEHFHALLENIVKKIKKTPHLNNQISFKEIFEKGEFIFANEKFYFEHTKNRGIKLKGNTFFVNIHSKLANIEKNTIKLLCEKYYEKTKHYIQILNKQTYNYKINDFELKNVKSKWGHCSTKNSIMLNIKLLNTDIEILNYVILHEISHIKHKNHSNEFWKEVERFCPNYKVLRKKLRTNPPQLFI